MARFRGVKKSSSRRNKSRHTHGNKRQNARRKPVLPRKGVTQSSYEAGFFDFLNVFWRNNEKMDLCSLTKQVANAWEALLPKPQLRKKQLLKDYYKEFQALREEEKKQQEERSETQQSSGTETEVSKVDGDESDRYSTDTNTTGENTQSKKRDASTSGDESVGDSDFEERGVKRKRMGRKYESYEEYQKAKNKNDKSETSGKEADKKNVAQKKEPQEKKEDAKKSQQDSIFFPMRDETSFDRIVKDHYDNQEEMLKKLKHYGSSSGQNAQKYNNESASSNSLSLSSVDLPKVPSHIKDNNSVNSKLSTPTDTLHVKNLVIGIRQPELQEIFKVFLNDIVLIRVLDNKYNGEAVVEFKNVEAAERVWKQMNGVEYKRLPLVLEFANKEDLIY